MWSTAQGPRRPRRHVSRRHLTAVRSSFGDRSDIAGHYDRDPPRRARPAPERDPCLLHADELRRAQKPRRRRRPSWLPHYGGRQVDRIRPCLHSPHAHHGAARNDGLSATCWSSRGRLGFLKSLNVTRSFGTITVSAPQPGSTTPRR